MVLRLRTVRSKLTALVGLTALAAILAVVVLFWLQHRQLLDEVDDRVPQAARGFESELEDAVRDVESAARTVAARDMTATALRSRDGSLALAAAGVIHKAHPDIDVCLFDGDGKLLVQIGVAQPPAQAREIPELTQLREDRFQGVVENGCERPSSRAAPAYLVARRISAGLIVACLPLDRTLLRHARTKLGVQLAVIEPDKGPRRPTGRFPRDKLAQARRKVQLLEAGERLWAFARFEPQRLVGRKGQYGIVAALDVTAFRDIVRRNLILALAILVGTAAVGLLFGIRVASRMARALSRVSAAFRRLREQEYIRVDPVRTGDEIEDLAEGFNRMVDGLRERDKLRATMGKYMTRTVLEHLLSGKLQLGGETLQVTILFCDIRSFTALSERLDAQAVVRLLNEFFTAMVTILIEEEGVVDKYIGDAIMAVFGAPVPKADDAVRAVRAAVRMREALARLNTDLARRGLPEIRAGIGIHTGEVVAGNIGSEARMEYTVIGDAVNLAARLESATKELGASILISENTHAHVRDVAVARPVGEISVRGRARPVQAYELQEMRGEAR
jgi:adenylate cyclase